MHRTQIQTSFPRFILLCLLLTITTTLILLSTLTYFPSIRFDPLSRTQRSRTRLGMYPDASGRRDRAWPEMESLTIVTVNIRFDGKSDEPVPIPDGGSVDLRTSKKNSRRQMGESPALVGRTVERLWANMKRSSGSTVPPIRPQRLSDESAEHYHSTLKPHTQTHPTIHSPVHQPYSNSYPKFDPSERPWSERRSHLVDLLSNEGSRGGPDIVAFQEVLSNQMDDLKVLLGDGYGWVGVGRDDGKKRGEWSPIFYKRDKFEEVSHTSRWLSETPTVVGSVGWDASQTRIATFLTLRPRGGPGSNGTSTTQESDANSPPSNDTNNSSSPISQTPSQFHVPPPPPSLLHIINTHYDDQGKKARAQSSLLLRKEVRKWVDDLEEGEGGGVEGEREKGLVVLLGDFNSPAEEDGYQNMISPLPLPSKSPSFNFIDSITRLQVRDAARSDNSHSSRIWPSQPYGPSGTYTGFTRPGEEVDERIDFVFLALDEEGAEGSSLVSNAKAYLGGMTHSERDVRGGWKVKRYAVRDNLIAGRGDVNGWTGRWSDHRAVVVEIGKD